MDMFAPAADMPLYLKRKKEVRMKEYGFFLPGKISFKLRQCTPF